MGRNKSAEKKNQPESAEKTKQEIRMSNSIVEARYEYTEIQLDILFYLLSCLRVDEQQKPVIHYELNITELEKLRQKQINTSLVRYVVEDMGGKPISLLRQPSADGSTKEEMITIIWLFQKVNYIPGKKLLQIKLSEDVVPYLFDLKKEFTTLELQSIMVMNSKYAKRIYQLCSQWKNSATGQSRVYELNEFRKIMGLNEKEYPQISELKNRVLQVGEKQINEFSDLDITTELIKEGRSFEKIRFKVSRKPAPQLPIDFDKNNYNPAQETLRQKLISLGVLDEKLIKKIILEKEKEFHKWHYSLQTGKFKIKTSIIGHLLTTLGLTEKKEKT